MTGLCSGGPIGSDEYDPGMVRRKATITLDDDKLAEVRKILGDGTVSGTIDRALARVIRQEMHEHDARIYANVDSWTEDERGLRSQPTKYAPIDDDTDWAADYADVIQRAENRAEEG